MDTPERFYDDLADDYHLNYQDWRAAVPRQGEVLHRLIQAHASGPARTVLDCTCGIGTQSIGLALAGYDVTGTDISARSIDRARRETASFGVSPAFAVADVREVATHLPGPFDVVISCDNSLPHLLTDDDLAMALANMHSLLRPGGLLVTGIRDYDALRRERPRFTPPQLVARDGQRSVLFQLWDWAENGETYTLTMFRHTMSGGEWISRHGTTRYRALQRAELDRLAEAAGFTGLAWRLPAETGHHQPLLAARKSQGRTSVFAPAKPARQRRANTEVRPYDTTGTHD